MKAFIILPQSRSIEEVNYSGDYKQIYDLIGARAFDIARLYKNGDGAYVDDEGLYAENQFFWIHRNYPSPLAGTALLLGCNEEGEDTAPNTSIEQLIEDVKWVGDRHDVTCLVQFYKTPNDDYRPMYFPDMEAQNV